MESAPLLGPIMYLVVAIGFSIFVLNLIISFLGTAIGDAEEVLAFQRETVRLLSAARSRAQHFVQRVVFDKISKQKRLLTTYRDALEKRLDELRESREKAENDITDDNKAK